MAKDKGTKKLKDPIYGYVEIPVEYITAIIDTAEFQRLRRIVQTSYSPLYSSAIHNRFVHSIGVFYLGSIVSERLRIEIVDKAFLEEEKVKHLTDIYKLACLLHDVGHAPFSHTGECFYKNAEYKSTELHERIGDLVGNPAFKAELLNNKVKTAAPHELMSVIIGLNKYSQLIGDCADKEFFARCITGYTYETTEKNDELQIKNCLIGLLNSKVIDVDRLDYLIRDAYITGFETVNIDYDRLLNALTIVFHDNKLQVAYKKYALSIIENVVYAHGAEKKWIQNHPVVLYEAYLIKHIIMNLNSKLNVKDETGKITAKLFSEEALSENGTILNNSVKISLLCDDDVICLYKNMFMDDLSREYFHRNLRRHPLWKSEAEYRGYIKDIVSDGRLARKFNEFIEVIAKGDFNDLPSFTVINETHLASLERQLADAKAALSTCSGTEQKSVELNITGLNGRIAFCKKLFEYANANGIEKDFIILRADIFNSNFSKEFLQQTLIVFNDGDKENVFEIHEVCPTLKAEKENGIMFYIFCRKKEGSDLGGIKDFCEDLFLSVSSVR